MRGATKLIDAWSHLEVVTSFLSQNWLGTLIGCIGLGLTIYQFIRKQDPIPAFQYYGQRLISSSGGLLPNEVSVQYDGVEVNQISITNIAFWNRGKNPIRGQDLLEEFPLSFGFPEGEILKADILKVTREPIKPLVLIYENDSSNLKVSFSFLDRGDGFLLRILHTSHNTKPVFKGTIVGVPKGTQDLGRVRYIPIRNSSKKLTFLSMAIRTFTNPSWPAVLIFFLSGLTVIYTTVFYHDIITPTKQRSPEEAMLIVRIVGSMTALLYLTIAYFMWRRVSRRCPDPISFDD